MPIDEVQAEDYLASRLDWDVVPELSATEKDSLLATAREVDAAGLYPDADDYELTYSYNSLKLALVQGCEMKMSKAAETTTEDGENLLFEHWKYLRGFWAGQVIITDASSAESAGYSHSVKTSAYW